MHFVGYVASRGSLAEASDTTSDLYLLCASVLIGQALSDCSYSLYNNNTWLGQKFSQRWHPVIVGVTETPELNHHNGHPLTFATLSRYFAHSTEK